MRLLDTHVGISSFVSTGAREGHVLVASFVYNETADLTLVSLLPEAPYKVLAMTAERWLFEETRHETVILDHVDILFLQGSFSSSDFLSECGVCITGPEGILARVVCFLIVRHRALHLSIFLRTDQGVNSSLLPFRRFFPSQSKDARADTNRPLKSERCPSESIAMRSETLGNEEGKRERKRCEGKERKEIEVREKNPFVARLSKHFQRRRVVFEVRV